MCFPFLVLFFLLWLHSKHTWFTKFYTVTFFTFHENDIPTASSVDYLLAHFNTLVHRPCWKKARTVWPRLHASFGTECFIQKSIFCSLLILWNVSSYPPNPPIKSFGKTERIKCIDKKGINVGCFVNSFLFFSLLFQNFRRFPDTPWYVPDSALVKLVYMANLLKIVYKNGSFNSPIFSTLVLL